MSDAFRALRDYEIDGLDDQRLLAYVDRARRAGRMDAAMDGVSHLVYRHVDSVRARVAKKLPPHLVDDMTHDALVEAIASAFGGTTIGEFHKWLSVIVQRFIADFYRGPKGRQLERDRAAGYGHQEDDDLLPAEVAVEGDQAEAEVLHVIELVISKRPQRHQDVIDAYVFEGFSAKETAERCDARVDNVYKIAQRFRDDLKIALQGGDVEDLGDTGEEP